MNIERNLLGVAQRITMRRPFDAHQHPRDGDMMRMVVPYIRERFAGMVVMPNLRPPITTVEMASDYHRRLRIETGPGFESLMTLYLTDHTDGWGLHSLGGEVERTLIGAKYYPRGLTTNSDAGIADPSSLWRRGRNPHSILQELAYRGMVLFIHAADGVDQHGKELDPYDQERHFIEETLPRIVDAHPSLKISVEHISTAWGVEFMRAHGGECIGCSITPHHLLLDRRDVFRGGFQPHRHWWPIIQSDEHRQELRKLVQEGHAWAWLGSDSAPHPRSSKEAPCCAGGVMTAHIGLELYVEAFDEMDALDKLEPFAAEHFLRFVGRTPADETIQLERHKWTARGLLRCDDLDVVPFRLGETMKWRLCPE